LTTRASLPAGTLVMLILKTLSYAPLHGYAIAQEIKRASHGVLHIEEGSLYPALQKALANGWVTAEWVKVGPKREARVYRLTPAGKRRLAAEVSDYSRATEAVVRIIRRSEA
jgi:PadR family transcriptional regulator, regulatory protein PadR